MIPRGPLVSGGIDRFSQKADTVGLEGVLGLVVAIPVLQDHPVIVGFELGAVEGGGGF